MFAQPVAVVSFLVEKMRKSSFKAYKKCINYFFAIFSDGKTRSLWKEHFFLSRNVWSKICQKGSD